MKVGRGVRGWGSKGAEGQRSVGEPAYFPASGSLLLEGRWDLLSSGKSSVTPLASSADLSSAIDTI